MSDTPGPDYGGPERRQHERYTVQVMVQVADIGELQGALTEDLSEGGIMLRTHEPRRIGSLLPLTIIHPETGVELPLITEVVRHIDDNAGRIVALGLAFHDFDELSLRRLRTFLADVRPRFDVGRAAQLDVREPTPQPLMVPPPDPGFSAPGAVEPTISMSSIPIMDAMTQQLPPMLLHLLIHVNGKNTVEVITRKSGLHVDETLAGLKEMLALGVIQVGTEPAPIPEVEEGTPNLGIITDEHQEEAAKFQAGRVSDYLARATNAEADGQLAEAIRLLQLALTLEPGNPAEIHLRLARLAYNHLLDTDLAEEHAIAGLTLQRDQPDLRRILQEIRTMQAGSVGKVTRPGLEPSVAELARDERKPGCLGLLGVKNR